MIVRYFTNGFHFQVAYTFDAGPNACLYLLEEDVARVISLVSHFFPPETETNNFITGLSSDRISLDKVFCSCGLYHGQARFLAEYFVLNLSHS